MYTYMQQKLSELHPYHFGILYPICAYWSCQLSFPVVTTFFFSLTGCPSTARIFFACLPKTLEVPGNLCSQGNAHQGVSVSILFRQIPKGGIAESCYSAILSFLLKNLLLFTVVVHQFIFPPAVHRLSFSPYLHQHLLFLGFFVCSFVLFLIIAIWTGMRWYLLQF